MSTLTNEPELGLESAYNETFFLLPCFHPPFSGLYCL